jgi:hypothetical protein
VSSCPAMRPGRKMSLSGSASSESEITRSRF